MEIFFSSLFQEEETEIEIIEYTTTTSSKKEVIESKTPIISGQVVELGSRTKQSEVSLQKVCNIRLDTGWKQNNGPERSNLIVPKKIKIRFTKKIWNWLGSN